MKKMMFKKTKNDRILAKIFLLKKHKKIINVNKRKYVVNQNKKKMTKQFCRFKSNKKENKNDKKYFFFCKSRRVNIKSKKKQ